MTLPPPLTPTESDLTVFKDMPFEVVRFAKSDLVAFASAEGIVAALMLWGSSWHSRPAGSLTDDDRALAKAAGFGRAIDAWIAVKGDALRGWIKCSDGRLYHPVVAEKVRASWLLRLKQMHRNYGSAVRMHNSRNPQDKRDALGFEDWLTFGQPEGVAKEGETPPKQVAFDLENGECDAQHADSLRATDHDVRDSDPTKGREGKGREGKGVVSNGASAPLERPAAIKLRPAHIVEAWNELAEDIGLRKIVKVTGQREKHLAKRIEEFTIEQFREALDAIRRSRFLSGRKPGSDFKATFDFFLQPSSFVKILEGNYDD